MATFYRCDGGDETFLRLTRELDEDLNARYGAQMEFYNAFNGTSGVSAAIVALEDGVPAGCGCFKPFSDDAVEMKRIFVKRGFRGRGISKELVRLLEEWALSLGFERAVLETGVNQPEAIGLYESAGYRRIPNYEPYRGVENSVCYEKRLGAKQNERPE